MKRMALYIVELLFILLAPWLLNLTAFHIWAAGGPPGTAQEKAWHLLWGERFFWIFVVVCLCALVLGVYIWRTRSRAQPKARKWKWPADKR